MTYLNFFQFSPLPSDAIGGHYNFFIVALSFLVATLTSFVALEIAVYLREGKAKTLYWPLLGGAFAMGSGIFTMHFVGMIAFIMPMTMGYQLPLTFLSIIVAIAASALALFIVRKPSIRLPRLIWGGIAIGVAIAGMHYIGMTAMIGVRITYLPLYFALSIAIAIVAGTAALWMMLKCDKLSGWRQKIFKLFSALFMGTAICGMHYMGMAAAVFVPLHDMLVSQDKIVISPENLAFAIAFITAIVLFVGLYTIGKQHTVLFKLIFGYSIIVAMMAPLAYTSLANISTINKYFTRLTTRAVPRFISLLELKGIVAQIDEAAARLTPDLSDAASTEQKKTLTELIEQLHRNEESYRAKALVINDAIIKIREVTDNIESLSSQLIHRENRLSNEQFTILKKELKQNELELVELVDKQINEENENLSNLQKRGSLLLEQSYILTGLIIIVIALLATFLSIFISLSISKPIINMRNTTHEIAKGDLRKRVEVTSNDEFGQLGKSFNIMVTELEGAKKKRDEFMGMAAHDLRVPLALIREGSQLLNTQALGTLNEKQIHILDMISKASSSMMSLLDELLTVNEVQSRIIQINPKITNIIEFLENIFTFNQLLAEKKHIELKMVNQINKQTAFFDANKISQVINNFISNAIKFSQPNTKVEIVAQELGEKLRFSVKDEAGGIPEEEQKQVFRWFSKISVRPTAGEPSHGLGLAICKEIIEAHQGVIGFESTYGKGSTFFFEITAFKNQKYI